MNTACFYEEADAHRRGSQARGRTPSPAPADRVLAMQRGAGNQAVARMLSRTVTLKAADSHDREPQSAEQVKAIVTARVPAQLLPELDAEIANMVGPSFTADYASEQKLFSGVIECLQRRYAQSVGQSHPRAAAIVGQSGGTGTLAWTVRLAAFPADLEDLLARLEPLVEAEDMRRQFKDVFGKAEGMAGKLADGRHVAWIKGKQAQLDGLLAELRVAGRTSADQLAAQEKMRFGKKFSAPSAATPTESSGGTSSHRPQEVSVKADLSYTDSAGVLWFVEIAEGVEGLRKKVTRLDAHQRAAYQAVAKAQSKPTRLKYVCVDPAGWMKLCNVDKDQPSPAAVMAQGGWTLDLGNEALSTAQLAQAGHNGLLLYGNYSADTIGRNYRKVWSSLSAFAADTDPVSKFTGVVQPVASTTAEGAKTDEPIVS